jgi:hypothetical protein
MKIAFELDVTNETSLFSKDVTLWFTTIESGSFSDECRITVVLIGVS